ncbi:glycoside hydrolase family 3 N-terminal domain-containing protein [Scatolibacter rhodanostii]|uniref:glycoside hydrolase family 3 N-terminal domain-containing protein n=1 Tax=Scatolibacter rhodanostii TaxID=2014781 RepID=UPI000C06816A|nr:glycoside hydrolase family 3 N-terminal domain-containing protein [Scatolibacter rhodanostii]
MEKYLNTALSPEERAEDLLQKLNLREKVGQVNQHLYGFSAYERENDDFHLAEDFCKENEYWGGIGVLYGLYRADPWSQKDEKTGIPPRLSAKIYNQVQRAVIEKSRFGIPALMSTECPHGHQAVGGYLLPVSLSMGATFDPELVQDAFGVVAEQIKSQGVDFALISVLDVLRDPRWGRSEECFGEDPYLCASMAGAAVRGCQEKGVDAVVKHLCAQGQTTGGVNASAASIGKRELYEIHLPAVKSSIQNGAVGVMAAYNEIDGVFCHANPWLLKEYLRDELGFEGIVMADGTAIDRLDTITGDNAASGALALKSGVDVSLWDQAFTKLEEAVQKGFVDEERLNEAVRRVLTLKFKRGLFEKPYLEETELPEFTHEKYTQSQKLAEESIVLLKNNGALPLQTQNHKIAVIGPVANDIYHQLGDYTPPVESGQTILEGLEEVFGAEQVSYAKGTSILAGSQAELDEAVTLAEKSDVVILTLGGSSSRFSGAEFDINGAILAESKVQMDCGEGIDSASLNLPGNQMKLAEAIIATGKTVITVVQGGRAYNVSELKENSAALLYAFYPGPCGGKAIADIISGRISPSGRLPVSLPYSAEQLPCYYNAKASYAAMNYYNLPHEPVYAFGYGLSYTNFSISHVAFIQQEESVIAEFEIENTGDIAADAVPMLFIQWKTGEIVGRVKELKAFKRVSLSAHESKKVSIVLEKEALSRYGADMKFAYGQGEVEICLEEGGKQYFTGSVKLMSKK